MMEKMECSIKRWTFSRPFNSGVPQTKLSFDFRRLGMVIWSTFLSILESGHRMLSLYAQSSSDILKTFFCVHRREKSHNVRVSN